MRAVTFVLGLVVAVVSACGRGDVPSTDEARASMCAQSTMFSLVVMIGVRYSDPPLRDVLRGDAGLFEAAGQRELADELRSIAADVGDPPEGEVITVYLLGDVTGTAVDSLEQQIADR